MAMVWKGILEWYNFNNGKKEFHLHRKCEYNLNGCTEIGRIPKSRATTDNWQWDE